MYGTQIPSRNDGYTLVNLGFNFKFFDKEYTQVSISTNGYICLGNNTLCDNPKRQSPYDILVGLNYDLDPSRLGSGQIYYKHLSSDSDIIPKDVILVENFYQDTEFVPTNIFVITYDNVLTSEKTLNSTASFQIFLINDNSKSYVKFKYTSCLENLSSLVSSGINYKNNMHELQEVIIENGNECISSNLQFPGTWLINATKTSLSKKIL